MYTSKLLFNFLHDLIRTYKSITRDGYSLHVDNLPHYEKKLFLSHIVDAYEYEFLCESPSLLDAGINEYKKMMQRLIDQEIDGIYFEDQRAKGRRIYIDSINGEARIA